MLQSRRDNLTISILNKMRNRVPAPKENAEPVALMGEEEIEEDGMYAGDPEENDLLILQPRMLSDNNRSRLNRTKKSRKSQF